MKANNVAKMMVAVAVMALAGCDSKPGSNDAASNAATEAKPIRVGATYPLSGPNADTGKLSQDAVQLAVDVVNGKIPQLINLALSPEGGLPNHGNAKLEFVFADNQASPEKGASEAERLINQEKVVAMYGGYNSSVTATASQVAERSGIPYLNDISSSPALTRRGFKWFYSNTPDDLDFGEMFFKFLDDMKAQQRSVDRVGIIWENSAYGTDAAKAEREFAAKYGYQVQVDIGYPSKTTNVSSEIQKLKAENPDVLLANSYISDAVLYIRGFKDANYAPQAILAQNSGFIDPQFITILGADANYILSREVFSVDVAARRPFIKEVNDLFKQRTGFDMNVNSARAFQGVLVLADALNRAASTKPEDIRTALAQTDIPAEKLLMPWEGIKFDASNKNVRGRGIIVQIQDGRYVTVWPADVATAQIVWPFPAWDKR